MDITHCAIWYILVVYLIYAYNLYLLNPNSYFSPSPFLLPFGNHWLVLYNYSCFCFEYTFICFCFVFILYVQIDWEILETMTDFIFLGSKITAAGDCSHKIKKKKKILLLGRKTMANLNSILKNRDITLPTKVCIIKAMVFPVVIYAWESWTIKKAESWRIDAFEL